MTVNQTPGLPSVSKQTRCGEGNVTLQAGVGTHATERISYRLTGGWSRFEYAGGAKTLNGFTYQGASSWQMTDRWTMMLLASSYYQPSEQEYGSAVRVDSFGWGLGHAMVRGKLNATFDLNYRHEKREYSEYRAYAHKHLYKVRA